MDQIYSDHPNPGKKISQYILEKFSLRKIKNNIIIDIHFFDFLIKKVFGNKKVNTANNDKNMFTIMFLVMKNGEDCYF